MKALVFEQPEALWYATSTCPRSRPTRYWCARAMSASATRDFELYAGRYIIPVSYPIIPGHEWAGEIAEVGSDVTTLRTGDRVVGECVVNNGDDHFGFSISGADAEYFVAKAAWLHTIPDELSLIRVRSSSLLGRL